MRAMTPIEYRISAVGSSELSRCATAKTRRSPFRADSIARSVEGLPAAIGWVRPGKITVPLAGEREVFDAVPLSFRSQRPYLDTTVRLSHTASFALVDLRQQGMKCNTETADSTRRHAN